jgi:hypothetical protein
MKETNKTSRDFVKETAASFGRNAFSVSLPKDKESGNRMIKKDVAQSFSGIKRAFLTIKSQAPKIAKYWLKLWNQKKYNEANNLLLSNAVMLEVKSLEASQHKANFSKGKVKASKAFVPTILNQIPKMQKAFAKNVFFGKSPWALIASKLGINSRISKKLASFGVSPIISESTKNGYSLKIENSIDYATHILPRAMEQSSLQIALKSTFNRWKRMQSALMKKLSANK